MALFLGIVPLLVFVIVDSFAGLKAGLITALVLAVAEAIFSIVYLKRLDFVTLITLATVVIFIALSYKKQSVLWIKLQPSVMGAIIGLIFVISFLIDRPILLEMALKYRDLLPTMMKENVDHMGMQALLNYGTFSIGIGHFIHAAVCAMAAFKMNNWWWIGIRSVGYYLILFLCMMMTNIYLVFKFSS